MALPSDSCLSPSTFSPSFLKQELYDWWLIKAETAVGGNQLAVEGFTYKEKQDARVFHSTAIAKRHDTVTLQAVDGITIILSGFINRSRTLRNGFSYEVCDQFLLGFPHNWEEFAGLSFGESTNEDAAVRISVFSESIKAPADGKSSSTVPVDHLPAYTLRDLLISSFGDSEGGMLRKSILAEIVHGYSKNASNAGEGSCLNQKSGSQVTTCDFSTDETPRQKKKAKANQKLDDEEFQKVFFEGIPRNSVLDSMMHMSGDDDSITNETSCLDENISNQVTSRDPSLDETPNKKNKAAANLGKEDENHVPDAQCRKEVFQKSNHKSEAATDLNSLSSSPLTRGKASLYKKITVNQKHKGDRYVCNSESGRGDFRIMNDNSTNGPLTRSKAQTLSRSSRKKIYIKNIVGGRLCRLTTSGY